MRSIATESKPAQPRLGNRLGDLAERAGEAARGSRRGSMGSIEAYLLAGALLAEARGECRRGAWGVGLERAGIASRSGRRKRRIARRAGADGRVHAGRASKGRKRTEPHGERGRGKS